MKKILFAAVILLGICDESYAQKKVETLVVKTNIYCDHCQQCGSCGERIKNAVFTQKGIKRVDVDEKAMTIQVVYNTGKTDADKIRKAITASGFDADEMKAIPEAYAKLDECCQKK